MQFLCFWNLRAKKLRVNMLMKLTPRGGGGVDKSKLGFKLITFQSNFLGRINFQINFSNVVNVNKYLMM